MECELMQRAWIISIGTELTLGQSLDTNGAWLARELAALGVRAERHVTVPDELQPITAVALAAAASGEIVLITGGLGPTDDDLTRQALADAADTHLELDSAALEQIRAYFASRGREMPERNHSQAMSPVGGRLLANRCGTAPGVFVEICGTPCFAMPGVPFEMKAMFAEQVVPAIRAARQQKPAAAVAVAEDADSGEAVLLSRIVRTYGLPEAEIGERLRDLMVRGRNPEVGTTADMGEIGVRINAAAASGASATDMLDAEEREIRNRLGKAVYGIDSDTLAGAVGQRLIERGRTLCVAESCTGGLLGMLLTETPGSSQYFLGGEIAYSNEVKQRRLAVKSGTVAVHGAVSQAVASEMAAGARAAFGATYALSITGIAGPGGGTPQKPVGLVYIGLATPEGVRVREIRMGDQSPRGVIRQWAARTALNLLRMELG
jgi:nicotinamide-nucleotide amidase